MILDRSPAVWARGTFMHTRFPLWRPLQTWANSPEANVMSPSFEMFSERIQERGRIVLAPQTLRRTRTLFIRRPSSMFGASKTCTRGSIGCSDYPRLPHLIKDIDEGQSIVALQRHRCVHTLLRCQHLGESAWERSGSYVDGRELHEERILESWSISGSGRELWFSWESPERTVTGRHDLTVGQVEIRDREEPGGGGLLGRLKETTRRQVT